MDDEKKLIEKKISSERIFSGNLLNIEKDTVKLSNGNKATREFIRHIGAAAVVPITDDGYVIMERQFRYPLNKVIWEIPAGKLDSKEEDPEKAAIRELREETGYIAGKITPIGTYYPTCAYSDEIIYLFVAENLKKGERDLDDDEFVNVHKIKFSDLVQEVAEGKISDGKTIAAILRADYYKRNNILTSNRD